MSKQNTNKCSTCITEAGMSLKGKRDWDGKQAEPFKGNITHKVLMAIIRTTLVLGQYFLRNIYMYIYTEF